MKDQDMLSELIIESREHLQNIEPDLLELEGKGGVVSDDLINRVFRAVHSIKGGFGFFGIENIVKLSHAMENVMSRVRDKELNVTSELVDALLKGIDKLRTLLDDVSVANDISIADELTALLPFLDSEISIAAVGSSENQTILDIQKELKSRHPDLNDDDLVEAVRNGRFVYQILVDPVKDVSEKNISYKELFEIWEKFGTLIVSNPSRDSLERGGKGSKTKKEISVIFMSVLEPDLISEAIDIPLEKIYSIDLTKYKKKLLKEQETMDKTAASTVNQDKQITKIDNRIEDALRVKVSLLNNLMNFAGELVLGRNQLIQTMNRKTSESLEIEKTIKNVCELFHQSMTKIAVNGLDNDQEENQHVIDSEVTILENKLKDSFNFQLRDILGVNSVVQNIDMVTTMLQESIMQTRMQPISVVFSKFPRVIRDLGKKLKKEINLTQIGQDVELDKSIIELLSDPLTHLIRNSADHGIEKPSIRRSLGKDPMGKIILKAYQEGGKVIIEIVDDGAGINFETVKHKAIERNIISKEKAEQMTPREIQMLIFTPGFSTAKQLSDVSGRGVGMDVVKTNIERLGGTIELDSEVNKGTKIDLKLPLTLAIIPSLIVSAEGNRFAVPQIGLEEVVRIRAQDLTQKIERVHKSEVLRLRGKLLPLVRLASVLGLTPTYIDLKTGERQLDRRKRLSDRRNQTKCVDCPVKDDRRKNKKDRRQNIKNTIKVVVLRMEKKLYGLIVDDVQDSEEIVVKPLPEYIKGSQCYAGATIMGDGKVAMILDPNGIAMMAKLKFDEIEKEISREKKRQDTDFKKALHNMLLFSIGGPEHFAIDLSAVSRIEKRRIDEIEVIGDREFLKYEHSSLRLFRIEMYMPVQPPQESFDHIFVIVPKSDNNALGLITAKVEDTIETELKIDTNSVKGTGISGSAIIDKKMTVVINVPELLNTLETEMQM